MKLSALFAAISIIIAFAPHARAADPYANLEPYWVLIHEPAVLDELKLTTDQRQSVRNLTDRLDAQFFPLRNRAPAEAKAGVEKLVAEARRELAKILSEKQTERLSQIQAQKLEARALLHESFDDALNLEDGQRKQIQEIIEATGAAVVEIQRELGAGKPAEPLQAKYVELKTDEQRKIIDVLRPRQVATWSKMVGIHFDPARLGQPRYKAPELIDSGAWINGSAQSLASLRGKVVVLHFYAADCINCIRNLPAYRAWHEDYAPKGVVVIGVHTPETSAERDADHVRRKADDARLTFPILIDRDGKNWNAWGNSVWPTVYVIDRRGYVRDLWQGELNWQGAKGDAYVRERIEQLLGE